MFTTSMPKCSKKTSYTNLIGQTEKYEGPNAPVRPRIAIIGAGVTGVSTACHILDAGYECHIFESGSQDRIGGIWSRVNATSKLQIHSKFYTFHPAVQWKSDYPDRQEILGEIHRLWNRYNLASRSSFNTSVDSTYEEEDGKWIVNDSSNGYFDGVIAAIGTCGELNMPKLAGQEQFKGDIIHSSELVTDAVKGKDIVVVGGGASAVEALEFACDNGAASVQVVARVSPDQVIRVRTSANQCASLRNGSSPESPA
jgi:cation diffusion facilitator CzcD-associated flavoprotein CzcO